MLYQTRLKHFTPLLKSKVANRPERNYNTNVRIKFRKLNIWTSRHKIGTLSKHDTNQCIFSEL